MQATAQQTLAGALGLKTAELVALVGGGGKSSALAMLVRESVAEGHPVVATTTTAMFLSELATAGPVVLERDPEAAIGRIAKALEERSSVGAARSHGRAGKVVGLPCAMVDRIWSAGVADRLLVEADGSRRRSLKGFAPYEPQVPTATTTTILVAGLDVVGRSLTEAWVHRPEIVSAATGRPLGAEVTTAVVAAALRAMLARLRRLTASRIVLLLNKMEVPDGLTAARSIAVELGRGDGVPDLILTTDLHAGRFRRLDVTES